MKPALSRSPVPALFLAAAILGLGLAGPAAASFPEITPEQRSLTRVPGDPNASAVVLFRKAEILTFDDAAEPASTITLRVRRKILTEEGKRYAEVQIPHGKGSRLVQVEARTVLPDGRAVPVPDSAIFRRRVSKAEKRFVTTVVFPAVEIGAILDYRADIRVLSNFWIDPWYFQEEIPTLYSEAVYRIPLNVEVASWTRDPMGVGLQQERRKYGRESRLRIWAENLPAVPDEPHNLPFADLSSRVMLVPTRSFTSFTMDDWLKDWPSTCELFHKGYEEAGKKTPAIEKQARSLTANAAGRREAAQALYRFVRDEIETGEEEGIFLPDKVTATSVLEERRGQPTAKALLLGALLDAAGFAPRLVWVAERDHGMVDMQVANPWWFDRTILLVELDGQRVFLDPSDRTISFGRLSPQLEGTTALIFDRKKPETLTLPVPAFEQNLRQARIELDLDAKGRLAGKGTLQLTGHEAWDEILPGTREEAVKRWTDRLAAKYPDFGISGLAVREAVDEQTVEVSWTMAQHEEEVLGDEASLAPSLPLGPTRQPFQTPMERRRSPVLLDHAGREEVELTLRWPEGWQLEALPKNKLYDTKAGKLTVNVATDEAARTLTFQRRLDVRQKLFDDRPLLESIQKLYGEAEKSDAQAMVLVRR